jgi:hypothetical protein
MTALSGFDGKCEPCLGSSRLAVWSAPGIRPAVTATTERGKDSITKIPLRPLRPMYPPDAAIRPLKYGQRDLVPTNTDTTTIKLVIPKSDTGSQNGGKDLPDLTPTKSRGCSYSMKPKHQDANGGNDKRYRDETYTCCPAFSPRLCPPSPIASTSTAGARQMPRENMTTQGVIWGTRRPFGFRKVSAPESGTISPSLPSKIPLEAFMFGEKFAVGNEELRW